MRQIEKDKIVFVRIGSMVLRGDAPATGKDERVQEKLTAPLTATVVERMMTSLLGSVDITLTSGKKMAVSVRRVLCPGVVLAQGANVTVLPTAQILSTP